MIYSLVITCVVITVLVSAAARLFPEFAETQDRLLVVLLFVLSGIGLFAVLFWLFQRRSFDYVEKLSDGIANIAEGDLNSHLEVREDDEFSEMAMNLNTMVDELRELIDRERESERSKNELITNIAHDLRTPLTSIKGYLELLSLKKDLPEDTRNQYISIACTKTKSLEKLIEDLFGFTKLNYGKIAMKIDKVDIIKLLSQLMDEFYPNFMEKELQYDLTSNVPACTITADGTLLARLFDNLINNAIKYGADGKRIDVKVHAYETEVEVQVINYGRIIPAQELPYIFDKFYRVEQSRSKSTGGTGLGLAIAKNIAEMHGGRIRVESDLHGTRFIVTLQINFDINKENFVNGNEN